MNASSALLLNSSSEKTDIEDDEIRVKSMWTKALKVGRSPSKVLDIAGSYSSLFL